MTPTGHVMARRQLGGQLRTCRVRAGYTRGQICERVEWSHSKLGRLEAGLVGVSVADLLLLMDLYRVEADEAASLGQLASLTRGGRGFWANAYRPMISPSYLTLLGQEADATRIKIFAPLVVPPVLQSDGYSRAVIQSASLGGGDGRADDLVALQQTRQSHLLTPDTRPRLDVVIDECALHRQVGGPEVMRSQLDHMIQLRRNPSVQMRILPAVVCRPWTGTAFTVVEFAAPETDVVFLEYGPTDGVLVTNGAIVEGYKNVFDRLVHASLNNTATGTIFDGTVPPVTGDSRPHAGAATRVVP